MITGNADELNQVKSVINGCLSIVHVFQGELMMQKNIRGQTEAEAELSEALETLFQSGTEVNMNIDFALRELADRKQLPADDVPPWEGPEDE